MKWWCNLRIVSVVFKKCMVKWNSGMIHNILVCICLNVWNTSFMDILAWILPLSSFHYLVLFDHYLKSSQILKNGFYRHANFVYHSSKFITFVQKNHRLLNKYTLYNNLNKEGCSKFSFFIDASNFFFQTLGQTGQVLKVYSDGDLRVQVDKQVWTFNPACCSAMTHPASHHPDNTMTDSNPRDRLRECKIFVFICTILLLDHSYKKNIWTDFQEKHYLCKLYL